MDLKAKVASGYRTRLILIALGALLYASWSYYDAEYKYPDKMEAFRQFDGLRTANPDNFNQLWADVAVANGWDPDSIPEEVSEGDIDAQWWQFWITFPIGMYCLISLALWSRRYVGADDEKLYTHGGVAVPFDSITKIDAMRWDSKGIAYVDYDLGQGEKSLTIDDWKYEREAADAIFDRVRENVSEDKIIGLSEPVAEDDAEASADDPGVDEDKPAEANA